LSELRRLGNEAEDAAADYLLSLGYTIVTRRFHSRRGEIDIVAMDGAILVCVEVKFRRGRANVAESGIDRKKVERMRLATLDYLQKSERPEQEFRFDVIAIDDAGIRHHINALGG